MISESKEKEVDTSKNNKKRNIILIVIGLLILIIILFLLWFFNRKFEVTLDYNNGAKEDVIYVKYNKTISKKDIKTKEDLGEQFINWYLVLKKEKKKDVLSDKAFDFKTKINKNIKLKALYKGEVETITVTFDSKGGSSVDSVTINKGAELVLPKEPVYEGYTFKGWVDINNTPIYDKVKLSEDTTLYATWEKIEEKETTKRETTKRETTKQEVKKEEKISLSLSNYYININGTKTSKATANVENASGEVTYSISSVGCATIDSKTGVITAASVTSRDLRSVCYGRGETLTVTAKLPSGKSASQTMTLEKNLSLEAGNRDFAVGTTNKQFDTEPGTSNFTITADIDVTWTTPDAIEISKTSRVYKGRVDLTHTSFAHVTASTKGGQKLEIYCYKQGA